MKRIIPALFFLLVGCNVAEPDFEYKEYPVIGDPRTVEVTPPDSDYFFVVVSAFVQAKEGGCEPTFRFVSWWKDAEGIERKEEKIIPAYGYGTIRLAERDVVYLDVPLTRLPAGHTFVCSAVKFDHPSRHMRHELSVLVHSQH